jgi:hypothetical protein
MVLTLLFAALFLPLHDRTREIRDRFESSSLQNSPTKGGLARYSIEIFVSPEEFRCRVCTGVEFTFIPELGTISMVVLQAADRR